MTLYYLIKAYHVKDKIYLVSREVFKPENKKIIEVNGFKPYFYAPSKLGEYESIFGETLTKIVVKDPSEVPREREKHEKHYEADVRFVLRFMIDKDIYSVFEAPSEQTSHVNIKPGPEKYRVNPRIWYIDIEVYTEGEFPDPKKADYPIISITVYDTWLSRYISWFWHKSFSKHAGKKKTIKYSIEKTGGAEEVEWEVRLFDDEFSMLVDFLDTYATLSPDILVAWNTMFDLEYIENRAKKNNLVFDRLISNEFDLMLALSGLDLRYRDWRLKTVTVEEGLEPWDMAKEAVDIIPLYKEKPLEVLKYNLRDVWRLVKLDELHGAVKHYWYRKSIVGLDRLDVIWGHHERKVLTKPFIDTLALRIARKWGKALPSYRKQVRGKAPGAYVLEPPRGIYENVAVLDMTAYYPTLILLFNISPEKKWKRVGEIYVYRQDSEGLLPAVVKHLLQMRYEIENKMKKISADTREYEELEHEYMAVKALINAVFGTTLSKYFRLYDYDTGKTILALGREGLKYLITKFREKGYNVLYCDTDSLFVPVEFEEAPVLAEEGSKMLMRYFMEKYKIKPLAEIKLKFEKYYDKILFVGVKKRYAGHLVWKKGKKIDKIEITGFEGVRSDYPRLTTMIQEEIVRMLLTRDKISREEIYDYVYNKIMEIKEKVESGELPYTEVALHKTLSKNVDEYESRHTEHVKAALYGNMYLGCRFSKGSKINYVFVSKVLDPKLPPTDVVGFESDEQIRGRFKINWLKQIDRIIISPLNNMLLPLGYVFTPSLIGKRWW